MMALRGFSYSLFAAATSGLLLAASFPPLDAGVIAWIALVPVLLVSIRAPAWQAGIHAGVMGAVFAGLYLYWIRLLPGFPVPAHAVLILYIAAYYAFFGFALRFLTAQIGVSITLVAPVLWVAMEFMRVNAGFLGVPGGLLGHSQYENVALIQIASYTSAYGVSFLIVLVNAAIADAILWLWNKEDRRKYPRTATTAATITLGPLAVGFVYLWGSQQVNVYQNDAGVLVKTAVVQANIPQEIKWDRKHRKNILARYRRLTHSAAENKPSLIVWPESALPVYLRVDAAESHPISALAKEAGVSLLVGSASSTKFADGEELKRELRNSAFLVNRDGEIVTGYDKQKLLPFFEYLPYADRIPWPTWLTRKGGSFVSGQGITQFELSDVPFGVVICWEALFPDPFREYVKQGAWFMLNLSNEARFDGTRAGHQFLAMTVFRAVEHRIWLIRAANTGVSAAIDPLGVVRSRVTDELGRDLGVSGVLTVTITAAPSATFYTRHGDVFAIVCVIMASALLTLSLIALWNRRGFRFRSLLRQNGAVETTKQPPSRADYGVVDRR